MNTPPLFSPEEGLHIETLQSLQRQRLRAQLNHALNVPFYRERLKPLSSNFSELNSLEELRQLPFTTKEDMRSYYPLGLLAVDRSQVARYHSSSGTTGRATFVAYTQNDLKMWATLCARFLYASGVRAQHSALIGFGYGLFTGGFGLHYGLEHLGVGVIPASSGNTARQAILLRDLAPEILVCTPSYALNIAEYLRHAEIDPSELNLKFGHFGGEMWTQEMRTQIEQALGLEAFNNYGLSEVMGPGLSGECCEHDGMHVQEDHFIVECVDPKTLEPVPDGEQGELVFTSLTKEAMPIIRYRTRDIASLTRKPCSCGRTTVRMSRVLGRSDDMLIVRGVNVFPSQIEEALLSVEGVSPHYQIEISRPDIMDEVTVKVEISERLFSDKMSEMQELRGQIDRAIFAMANIHARIKLVAPQSLKRSEGKAVRVIDLRKI
jgi:phenylacetate-CoA ligase